MEKSKTAVGYNKLEVYSSQQWFSILDGFIETAFGYILGKTRVMEDYMAQLMLFQLEHKKRRVSLDHPWRDAVDRMAGFVSSPSFEALRALRLDRGYSDAMLKDFSNRTKGYEKTYEEYLRSQMVTGAAAERLNEYHFAVSLRDGRDMFQCVLGVNNMLTRIAETRSMLLNNYAAYLVKTAKDGDLAQDYYLAANKAINHFNSTKGTFKSYLDIWMKKTYMKKQSEKLNETSVPSDELAVDETEDPLEARIALESIGLD